MGFWDVVRNREPNHKVVEEIGGYPHKEKHPQWSHLGKNSGKNFEVGAEIFSEPQGIKLGLVVIKFYF